MSSDAKDEWSDVLVMSGFELYGTLNSSVPNRFQPKSVPQMPPPPYVAPHQVMPQPPSSNPGMFYISPLSYCI